VPYPRPATFLSAVLVGRTVLPGPGTSRRRVMATACP